MTDSAVPLLLIPGYWLGGWAWDAVAARLDELDIRSESITLPGLESASSARDGITFDDHVEAVLERVRAHGSAVLVAHSGAGAVVTAVLDRMPDAVPRVIYVDSGPTATDSVPRPDIADDAVEVPFPGWDALAADGVSIDGMSDEVLTRVGKRSVPIPAGAVREVVRLTDERRNAVPATIVCCSMPSDALKEMAASGEPMFAAVRDLQDVRYVDLPTGHWPMFSRPVELAEVLAAEV